MSKRTNKTSKTVEPTVTNQRQMDAAVLAKIVDKFGANGCTFNVNYTLSRKALGVDAKPVVQITTPNGPVTVNATILTLIGSHFGANDFAQIKSLSGDSLVWFSKSTADRIKAAGYQLTKWNKLRKADDPNAPTTFNAPTATVNAASLLGL
jgi:hypothetical protein